MLVLPHEQLLLQLLMRFLQGGQLSICLEVPTSVVLQILAQVRLYFSASLSGVLQCFVRVEVQKGVAQFVLVLGFKLSHLPFLLQLIRFNLALQKFQLSSIVHRLFF